MNKKEFIEVIKLTVRDSAIKDVISDLTEPPGRSPQEKLKEISIWFNSLTDEDKAKITEICKMSVDMSLFGIFCVFDGVRKISQNGKIILTFQDDDETTILNESQEDYLHELFTNLIDD